MENKVCIVTGASSGIGKGVATLLAKANAIPVLLSRDKIRGQQTAAELRLINKNVQWISADLASQTSIHHFVDQVKSQYGKCDYLFNCAGVKHLSRKVNENGLEMMFATNFLGHFLLTNLLFDTLSAAKEARVITVSNSIRRSVTADALNISTIDFDDLQAEYEFSFTRHPQQAILAKILFMYELTRRWEQYNITACTLDPGYVKTDNISNLPWFYRLYRYLQLYLGNAKTPEQAAQYLIDIANQPNVNGKYFKATNGALEEIKTTAESYDVNIAQRLWEVSERLVSRQFIYGDFNA